MLDFLADIKVLNESLIDVKNILKDLKNTEILVGVPQEESSHEGSVNNAELLYIHTNGSAVMNIPPRPVIEPAIEDNKQQIGEILKNSMEKALNSDREGAFEEFEKAGMYGQNAAREWFTNPKNNWAPNSASTIKKKGSDRPLIDTGEMRKSIVYVIRKK